MGQNLVVVARDGSLWLVSGKDGQVRELEGDELKDKILAMVRERQRAGARISELLSHHPVYDVGIEEITGVYDPDEPAAMHPPPKTGRS